MTGTIFEIKRFAVHDGPGIRSTLFLKGCPLHCPWCQNPEGMKREISLWHSPADCIGCGSCVAACPQKAIVRSDHAHIDHAKCDLCGRCIDACPAATLSLDGREVTDEEAAGLLLRDQPFYEEGGVTLSGGEVLSQWAFALRVLEICKGRGVDTAIETCLHTSRETLSRFLPVTDHFIIDIKYFDAETHRQVLGADNAAILRNYEFLVERGADVLVRTPLIPGYTATEENIRSITRYLVHTDPDARYELLNFNPLCKSKYAAMDREYPVHGSVLAQEEMERYYEILRSEGIKHIIRE